MSVFSSVPSSEWVASNRSGFAFRDRYPVTDGHTLVVPRREIVSWWEASGDERLDLLALVDIVKAALDTEYEPDGYNVGFNAGSAAGQTVEHFHIHVIPRRVGDIADPRGGVRHVIPERGNYLADNAATAPIPSSLEPVLIDARRNNTLHVHLRRHIGSGEYDRIDLLVSFIMKSGLNSLAQLLDDAIDGGAQVRVLTTDYLHVTDAEALARLLDMSETAVTKAGSLNVRVFHDPLTSFHPKAYLFWSSKGDIARGFVGSNNLSWSGIETGVEWSLSVDSVRPLVKGFEDLWTDQRSRSLTHEVLRAYRSLWTPTAGQVVAVGVETEPPSPSPAPTAIQVEALAALKQTRALGHNAGLVVMATGLGKTWLAAFDTATFDTPAANPTTTINTEQPTRFARTLFVAHREEILRQSRDVFRRARPGADLGLFNGNEKNPDAEVLFASIQTMSGRLHEFAPDAFDYVVVDEFHHAAAGSYRKLIDHFRPKFLLGLTATPERMDGADLLALCGDNLVFNCGLVEGIDRSDLVPFHYWGVKDVADFAPIPWRNGRFDPEALARAVETQQRAQQVFDEHQEKCGERTIGFCASVTHADFMAKFFNERGVLAAAVHSGPYSADRRAAVEDLRNGVIEVLFAVDVFNEGFDLPEIDSVMMLRPTESPVVFLQQLGRGLRKHAGKMHLQVVDFVGNHDSFLLKPRLLLSLGGSTTPTNRQIVDALTKGEFDLPAGCSVEFSLEAIDLLRQLASAGKRSGIEEYCLDYAREMGQRPTAAQAARSGYNPRSARPKHRHWFAMLESAGLLDDAETAVVARYGEILRAIEMEPVTKAYKLVTFRAMLAEGMLRTGGPIADIATRARRLTLGDPRLIADITSESMPSVANATTNEWESFWLKWPLKHLAGDNDKALFRIDGDRFVPTFQIDDDYGDSFDAMVAEIIEWRLADQLLRVAPQKAGSIRCKLNHAGGKPIIWLDRKANPDLPIGEVPILANGEQFVANFVKIAVNVAHRTGESANELSALLRGWFGPSAGHPGTNHAVLLEQVDGQWVLTAEGFAASGESVPFYPSFAIACGAFQQGAAPALGDTRIELRLSGSAQVDPSTQFVAVSRGESMAGGSDPIHHGDPLLFEWVRGVGREELQGSRVLVELNSKEGSSAVLKQLDKRAGQWLLVSNDPQVPVIEGTSDMTIVAKLVRRLSEAEISPLAKFIGERFKRDQIPPLFGTEYNPGNWQTGHVSLGQDVVLFVTLVKSSAMEFGSDYDDHFVSPEKFVWASQNSVGPDGKKGREILDALDTGTRIHLFVRVKKSDVAFEYCGRVIPVEHRGANPMSVTFRLLTALGLDSAGRLIF